MGRPSSPWPRNENAEEDTTVAPSSVQGGISQKIAHRPAPVESSKHAYSFSAYWNFQDEGGLRKLSELQTWDGHPLAR